MTLLSRHRLIIGRDMEALHRLEEGRFVAFYFLKTCVMSCA
jgi:hypothetical protein